MAIAYQHRTSVISLMIVEMGVTKFVYQMVSYV